MSFWLSYAILVVLILLLSCSSIAQTELLQPYQFKETNIFVPCTSYEFFPFPVSNHSQWSQGMMLGIPVECFISNTFSMNTSNSPITIHKSSNAQGVDVQMVYSLILLSDEKVDVYSLECDDLLSLVSFDSGNPFITNSNVIVAFNTLFSSNVNCLVANTTVINIVPNSALLWQPLLGSVIKIEASGVCKLTCLTSYANTIYMIGYMTGSELYLNRQVTFKSTSSYSTFVLSGVTIPTNASFISYLSSVTSTISCACHYAAGQLSIVESFSTNSAPRIITISNGQATSYQYFSMTGRFTFYKIQSVTQNQVVVMGYTSSQGQVQLRYFNIRIPQLYLIDQTNTFEKLFFAIRIELDPILVNVNAVLNQQLFTDANQLQTDLEWNQFVVLKKDNQMIHYLKWSTSILKTSLIRMTGQCFCSLLACHVYSNAKQQSIRILSVPLTNYLVINGTAHNLQVQSSSKNYQYSILNAMVTLSVSTNQLLTFQWSNRNSMHTIPLQIKYFDESLVTWYQLNGVYDLSVPYRLQILNPNQLEFQILQESNLLIQIQQAPFVELNTNRFVVNASNVLQFQYANFDYPIQFWDKQIITIPIVYRNYTNQISLIQLNYNEISMCAMFSNQESIYFELWNTSHLIQRNQSCVSNLLAGDVYVIKYYQLYHSIWSSEEKTVTFLNAPLSPVNVTMLQQTEENIIMKVIHDSRNQLSSMKLFVQLYSMNHTFIRNMTFENDIIVLEQLNVSSKYYIKISCVSNGLVSSKSFDSYIHTKPICKGLSVSYQFAITDLNLHLYFNYSNPIKFERRVIKYYIEVYGFEEQTLLQAVSFLVTDRRTILKHLLPSTNYELRIYLENEDAVLSSCYLQLQTYSYAPQPVIVILDDYADYLLVGWNSSFVNDAQSVAYQVNVFDGVIAKQYTVQDRKTEHRISLQLFDITPVTNYLISVITLTIFKSGIVISTPHLNPRPFTTVKANIPSKAPDIIAVEWSFDSVYATWNILEKADSGNAKIQAYHLQYNSSFGSFRILLHGEENTTYVITNLKPSTLYTLRVAAINLRGIGPFSEYVAVNTPDQPHPIDVELRDGIIVVLALVSGALVSCFIVLCCVVLILLPLATYLKKKRKLSTTLDLELRNTSEIEKRFLIRYSDINFEQSKFLGKGSYGTVVTAFYKKALVAVKIFTYDMLSGGEQRESFISEANFLAQHSHHSNIIRFIGVAEDKADHKICLLTELCTGGNLSEYILKNKQSIPFDTKIQLLYGIASGMYYLHAHNIVHRDLKCENVLLDGDLTPKIIDFGLSKQMEIVQKSIQMTMNMGSARYLAPEAIEIEFSPIDVMQPQEQKEDDASSTSTTKTYDKK